MRGPFSDILVDAGAGDVVDAAGGPLGVVKAGVFVVAVTLVFIAVVLGTEFVLETLLGSFVPEWLRIPLMVLSVGIVIIGAFVGVLRFMTWRRRRW